MMKIKTENSEDEIVGELHRVRAALLSEHHGNLSSLVKDLQAKQEASGKKVVERLNPAPSKLKVG